jgi:CRISPR system Cascade subunit CasB
MSGFIEWLEKLNERDTKVRATLRRSLSFDPGAFPSAYPYVEPFLKGEDAPWRRKVHYLVAGLWAQHRGDRATDGRSLGAACAAHAASKKGSDSTERRFIALLDADRDQLPHRLRQMVALIKGFPLDWDSLLRDLLGWTVPEKPVQNRWARDFYRNTTQAFQSDSHPSEENA